MPQKKFTFILFILFNLLFTPLLQSDHYIEKIYYSSSTSPLEKTTPQEQQGATWIAKNKLRADQGEKTTIIRLDKKKIYIIDHSQKNYSQIDLPIDLEKALSPEAKEMLEMLEVNSSFHDTGEVKNIENWKARKFLINISAKMMGMEIPIKMEIWATKDIEIKEELYKKFSSELLSLNPYTQSIVKEFEKIEGYPVLSETSMKIMGSAIKLKEKVISVQKKEPPPGTYELPPEYKETAYNPFQKKEGNLR